MPAETESQTKPVELHCGDALEIVSSLGEFDYVFTDPPYPVGGSSSMVKMESILAAKRMMNHMAESFIAGVLRAIRFKPDACIWLMCDWRQVSHFSAMLSRLGFTKQSCIVWDKCSGGQGSTYQASHELILWSYRGKGKPDRGLGRDLVRCRRVGSSDKLHPFDKPPGMVRDIVQAFPPGRVLDPFCGAGGLLSGLQPLGWECVGVDIDAEAIENAERRLGDWRLLNTALC